MRRDCPRQQRGGACTRDLELQEACVIGDEVAVLVHDTYRDEGDILAVGGDARAVSDELKVMGTTCGADDLLGDSLTRLVVDDDLDFAWLVLCIHPHQAVALLTG